MESLGNEFSNLLKRRRPTNHFQNQSTSVQDSMVIVNPSLPQELVVEILIRLPMKSLLKFRSVSKSWLALITSPEFVQTHLSFSSNNEELTRHLLMHSRTRRPGLILKHCNLSSLFYESVTEAFGLDYPVKSDGSYKDKLHSGDCIVGSVNVLICVDIEKNGLFIGNPSLRKYKKLPNPRPTLSYVRNCIYGFGYDEFHDDYKVVGTFCSIEVAVKHEVKIYSLKSDSWKNVYDWPIAGLFGLGKFVNGKLHWATTNCSNKVSYIISFDLADETWGYMEQPFHVVGRMLYPWLRVFGGHLSLLYYYKNSHLDSWILKEYGIKESWAKMFTIKYADDAVEYSHMCYPISYMSNEDEILVEVGSTSTIYNPKDDSLRHSKVINMDGDLYAEIFVESLVCPFPTEETENATKQQRLKRIKKIE